MREIKFRAWHPVFRRMLSADYIHIFGQSDNHLIFDTSQDMDDNTRCPIMQYTGLKDKNGVEIYEGDILDFEEEEWGGKFTPEAIHFDDIIGEWKLRGSLGDVKEWRKVIGNIYENPELLND